MPTRFIQFLEKPEVNETNIVESLQKIYDFIGAEHFGRNGDNSFSIGGIDLKNYDKDIQDIKNRLAIIEEKLGSL